MVRMVAAAASASCSLGEWSALRAHYALPDQPVCVDYSQPDAVCESLLVVLLLIPQPPFTAASLTFTAGCAQRRPAWALGYLPPPPTASASLALSVSAWTPTKIQQRSC